VRDFKWDDSALEKQQKDIAELASQEKELWVSGACAAYAACEARVPWETRLYRLDAGFGFEWSGSGNVFR
jgi:hypothetical protein